MIYIKKSNHWIELYSDEIFTRCFNCGKEIHVDTDLLIEILKNGDLASTQIACCSDERPHLIRIK